MEVMIMASRRMLVVIKDGKNRAMVITASMRAAAV